VQKIQLAASDRYSVAGMSGTGKTANVTVLAFILSTAFNPLQRVVWVQTKDDPKDFRRLSSWGFVRVRIDELGRRSEPLQWVYLEDTPDQLPVWVRAQRIARWALKRKHVFLVLDEYAHCVPSAVSAGVDLKNLHKTGRGAGAGVGGLTQELAFVPRQLFSQANHKILHRLDYWPDIKIARELHRSYDPEAMARYGFWHRWSEGFGEAGRWHLYEGTQDWLDRLGLDHLLHQGPRQLDTGTEPA
jgi:hypothetical protein